MVVVPVTGEAAALVSEEQRRWNEPTEHEPYVVLVLREETPDIRLLRARLKVASDRTPPFPLSLGPAVAPEGRPHRGVHRAVSDPVGAWSWLREFLLAPPLHPFDVVPHVPVVQTGLGGARRARRALAELGGVDPALEFRVAEIVLVPDDAEVGERETYHLVAPGPGPTS